MNIKLIPVVTTKPAIYNSCSTRKMFWEEKFTPTNMTSCGKHNVRNHREINNGDQYIALDIYLELDFIDKRELHSSESRDYMGR